MFIAYPFYFTFTVTLFIDKLIFQKHLPFTHQYYLSSRHILNYYTIMNIKTSAWWKVILLLIGGLIFFFILYMIGETIFTFIPEHLLTIPFSFVYSIAVLLIYELMVRAFEHSWSGTLTMKKLVPDILKGLSVGILFFIIITGILFVIDSYNITNASFSNVFYSQFSHFFLVASAEEVIFRGIVFRLIDKKWNTIWALLVSALFFGLLHVFNDNATIWGGVAIAIEAGLLLGVFYKFSGTLWLPIGIHWAWNVMEGPVLGFPVSGNMNDISIISAEVKGSEIITGGAFGPEASIIAAVLGLAIALYVWWRYNLRLRSETKTL